MTSLFFVLIIIACGILAFFVLIQNPKGGGLAGSLSGMGTQLMGAKQSTDVVEKGTWYTAAALLVFTLASFVMTPKVNNDKNQKTRSEQAVKGVVAPPAPTPAAPATQPATPAQQPAAPAPQQ